MFLIISLRKKNTSSVLKTNPLFKVLANQQSQEINIRYNYYIQYIIIFVRIKSYALLVQIHFPPLHYEGSALIDNASAPDSFPGLLLCREGHGNPVMVGESPPQGSMTPALLAAL